MKKKTLLVLFLSLFAISIVARAENYPIKWTPKKIEKTLGLGHTEEMTVTFVSSSTLENVELWIVPELQPFAYVQPNHFENIVANTKNNVTLHFTIPFGTETKLYDGTIHLKVGSSTYPQTLKVEINIVDVVKIISTEGGTITTTDGLVNLNIPSGALSEDTEITISPTGEKDIAGEIYEFGPSGLNLLIPGTIFYFYNPNILPPEVEEEDLFLASIDEYLEILNDGQVDIVNHVIFGKIDHFSNIGPGAFISTIINTDDFDSVTSFRMPIGDAERIPQAPPPCGYYSSFEDLGENLELLNLGTSITFNDGAPQNEWYVSVKFLEPYFLGWHPGEDWNDQQGGNSDLGSPIHAIADGVVLYNKNEGNGFGNIIVVGHKLDNGKIIASVNAHMFYQSPCLMGTKLSKGDVIGLLGDTGGNWAAHLHFELTNENYPYIKFDNHGNIKLPILLNKGWHWAGNDRGFIENFYYEPSNFIKNFTPSIPQPHPVGSCDTPDWANKLVVGGNYAYVADGMGGVHVIDISNPGDPHIVGSCPVFGSVEMIALANSYVYVGNAQGNTFYVINVANPTNPHIVGSCNLEGFSPHSIALKGNYAFVECYWGGVRVIDISIPTNPQLVGLCPTPENLRYIALKDNYAFVYGHETHVVNISNPTNPYYMGTWDSQYSGSLKFSGPYAFVIRSFGLQSGLNVLNIINLINPNPIGYCPFGGGGAFDIVSNYAYVNILLSELLVIDISDPTKPNIINSGDFNKECWDLKIMGNYAYVAAGYDGLIVIALN